MATLGPCNPATKIVIEQKIVTRVLLMHKAARTQAAPWPHAWASAYASWITLYASACQRLPVAPAVEST